MPQQQTAPLLDEIVRALGERIGSETTIAELEAEVARYLEYGVPAEQARSIILRRFGVTPPKSAPGGARKTLDQVQPNESYVNLLVRIVAINSKEVTARGEKRTIQYGILGDESRTRPFTSWKAIDVQKGDVVKVSGAYTKEYQGEPQINFGDRVQIEKVESTMLPPVAEAEPHKVGLAELRAGASNLELTARVLSVESRSVQVQGQPKTVWSGMFGDATGKVPFSAWHDFGLKAGDLVQLRGGYVREWRGTPQLSFDEKASVEVVNDPAFPTLDEIGHAGPVTLAHLYGGGGHTDILVEATLLEVRPGSGLVMRCPDCKRVLQKGECRVHAKVTGKPDLRVKGILDDGTAAITVVFGRELTEALLGKTMDEYTAMAKEALTTDVVETEARTKLVARSYRVRGNVLVDEFGPMLLAREASLVQRDLTAAAEALLAELEGVA